MSLLIRHARLVPGSGSVTLPDTDVRLEGSSIAEIGPSLEILGTERVIEADGRVLLPGFVDAHTHALWAGDRSNEFELRLRGATYPEIARAGGGILSTVRAVRAASHDDLVESLSRRLDIALCEGTLTIEVKSGYGLSTLHELKMLHAIADAARGFPGTVVSTALLGHAVDPEVPSFVERVIEETLPAVHAEFPDVAVDAYCEEGAFSLADCRRLLVRAAELGHPLRLHADQFNALGAIDLAIELGLVSIDHLEITSASELQRLAESSTYAVVLPACGFHLNGPYANGRAFLDAGGRLVLASNLNPGTAPTSSMPLVIALALRNCGVSLSEAITATTYHPARLLGFDDRGHIARGLRADLILLRYRHERLLGYEFGGNPVDLVIASGRVVHERTPMVTVSERGQAERAPRR